MDLKTAIEHVSRRGPGMVEDRRVRLEVLERLASRLEGLRAATDECKSDCVKRIAAKSNVAWTAAVVDALGDSWQDESFTLKYAIGLEAMFETPDSGVYRADVQEPEVSARFCGRQHKGGVQNCQPTKRDAQQARDRDLDKRVRIE